MKVKINRDDEGFMLFFSLEGGEPDVILKSEHMRRATGADYLDDLAWNEKVLNNFVLMIQRLQAKGVRIDVSELVRLPTQILANKWNIEEPHQENAEQPAWRAIATNDFTQKTLIGTGTTAEEAANDLAEQIAQL